MSQRLKGVWRQEEPASTPILEMDGVTKRFGDVDAVRGVTFAVERGEFLAILGPSGCGKSTLLRLFAGFLEPSTGEVRILGRNANLIPAHRRPTNLVFQQLALFPHMSVFDNVAFGLTVRKVPRDQIRAAVAARLRQVGLLGLERRMPSELSGGQKQRVAIARALVNEPAALLLDEPLGSLDLKLRQQMQLELKRLNRETETTFVFVTHDQEEAMLMSDRIAVMSAGRIEQLGTARDIYLKPSSRFVAQFIGDTNVVGGKVSVSDRGTVIVEGAGFKLRAAGQANPGVFVEFSLRPENIRFAGAQLPLNSCGATVVDVSYLGASTRYECRTDGGEMLVALSHGATTEPVSVGDRVVLAWETASLVGLAGPVSAGEETRATTTELAPPSRAEG